MTTTSVEQRTGAPFIDKWEALSTTVTSAMNNVTGTATRVINVAKEIITKTTFVERDGIYSIKFPFFTRITFSWREILMIGAIVSSVIFAVTAFFSGSVLTGITYLAYTCLLTLGTYWLSELIENLKTTQKLDVVRASGTAVLNVLQELVKQLTTVFSRHKDANSANATTLTKIQQSLTGSVTDIQDHLKGIPGLMGPVIGEFSKVIALGEKSLLAAEARLKTINQGVEAGLQRSTQIQEATLALTQEFDRLSIEMGALERVREKIEQSAAELQTQVKQNGKTATRNENTANRLENVANNTQSNVKDKK